MKTESAGIAVLGAGIAGLTAARELADRGADVLLIEARERLGGRLLTHHDAESAVPIELGAEFIHGRPPATFSLMDEARLTACEIDFAHHLRKNGRIARLPSLFGEIDQVMRGLSRIRGPDRSFTEYLRSIPDRRALRDPRRLALSFVKGFDAADPDLVSARALARERKAAFEELEEEPQFRVLHGYGGLVAHLADSLKGRVRIRPGLPVAELRWERAGVDLRATGKSGEARFRARRAIVTLPVGVLKAPPGAPGSISFVPPLAEKRRALSRIEPGAVIKVILRFHEPFWEEARIAKQARAASDLRSLSFLHAPGETFQTFWTSRPLRSPVLTAWSGGPAAAAMAGSSQRQLVGSALDSLSRTLRIPKPALIRRLARGYVHDWPSDPYTLGAYSYESVGAGRARADLARPMGRTLFFAGEATDAEGDATTVAGAIASGRRAAREALES